MIMHVYKDNTILKMLDLRFIRNPPSSSPIENGYFERDEEDYPSYEKYNGYNGWDDETIDSAFEGDPEATWNVE
jgi:hypothetical protein